MNLNTSILFHSKNKVSWIIVASFIISNLFFIWSANSIFWDDWVFYNKPKNDIFNLYLGTSRPLFALFYSVAYTLINPIVAKLITLFSIVVSSLFISRSLKNLNLWSEKFRLVFFISFSCTPFYYAKIATVNLYYTLSVMLFTIAFWFLSSSEKKIKLEFITPFLLLIAATETASVLCLLLSFGALLFLFRLFNDKKILWKIPVSILICGFLLFLKGRIWPLSDMYETYNKISMAGIIAATKESAYVAFSNINQALTLNSFFGESHTIRRMPIYSLGLITIIDFGLSNLRTRDNDLIKRLKTSSILLCISFVACYSAVFPYVAVLKIPSFIDWDSRHQLLLPIGFAVGAVGVFNLLNLKIGKFCYTAVLIFICIWNNLQANSRFYLDGIKQSAIIANLRTIGFENNAGLFAFFDGTSNLNANERKVRRSELSGWLSSAFDSNTFYGAIVRPKDNSRRSYLREDFEKTWQIAHLSPLYAASNLDIANSYSEKSVFISPGECANVVSCLLYCIDFRNDSDRIVRVTVENY